MKKERYSKLCDLLFNNKVSYSIINMKGEEEISLTKDEYISFVKI